MPNPVDILLNILANLPTDKIETSRQSGISRIIALINTNISAYMSDTVQCDTLWHESDSDMDVGCDAMLLGSLMKGLSSNQMWPLPTAPYDGLSILGTAKKVQGLRLLSICETPFYSMDPPPAPGHG